MICAQELSIAKDFDDEITIALKEKGIYSDLDPLVKMRLTELVHGLCTGNVYPVDRCKKALLHAIEWKLQLYYIIHVDTGLYNSEVYSHGFTTMSENTIKHVALRKLSYDQTLIFKARALWERIMNFVYYLETGADLQRASKKSKKETFFKFVNENPRWIFLAPYKEEITLHDERFRTGEAHGGSYLRKSLIDKIDVDINNLFNLVNRGLVAVWENSLQIVQGKKANVFTDLHLLVDHKIDPQYL